MKQHLQSVATIRPEAEVVNDLKLRASEHMRQFCLIMDEAMKAGFQVKFQGVGLSQLTGRHEVVDLHLIKRY